MTCDHTDNWYTPKELYDRICKMTGVYPELDVCATHKYHMCKYYLTKKDNALICEWFEDVWCNAPGRHIQKFINRAHDEWKRANMNIIMLIPVNTICNADFEVIWKLFLTKEIEIYPLFGERPKFLDGRITQFKPLESKYGSRNGYIVLVFRKK